MDKEEKQHKSMKPFPKRIKAKRESSPANTPKKPPEHVPKDEPKPPGYGKLKGLLGFGKKTPNAASNGNFNSHPTPSVENAAPADVEMEENPGITVTPESSTKSDQQHLAQGVYRDDGGGPSPLILEHTVTVARNAVKDFSKDFVLKLKAMPDKGESFQKQMRDELNLIAQDAPEESDLKFVAQAYIALRLFSGFENASFCISNPGEKPWEVQHVRDCFGQFQTFKDRSQTVANLLATGLNLTFLSRFCISKFESLIPKKLEEDLFEGDCPHRRVIALHRHPDSPFYKSFLFAAVSIWLLQRLVFSFEQRVITYSPFRSDNFERKYMEPARPGIGDNEEEDDDGFLEVLFTVFPGFRISRSIVKSCVYVVEKSRPQPGKRLYPPVDSSAQIQESTQDSGLYPPVDDSSAKIQESTQDSGLYPPVDDSSAKIQESTQDSQAEGLGPPPDQTHVEDPTSTEMGAQTSALYAVQPTTPKRNEGSTMAKFQLEDTGMTPLVDSADKEEVSSSSMNDPKIRGDSLPTSPIPQQETSAITNAKSFSDNSSPKSSENKALQIFRSLLFRSRKSLVKSKAGDSVICQSPSGGGEKDYSENTPTAKPSVRDESSPSVGDAAAGAPPPSVRGVGPSPPTDEVGGVQMMHSMP